MGNDKQRWVCTACNDKKDEEPNCTFTGWNGRKPYHCPSEKMIIDAHESKWEKEKCKECQSLIEQPSETTLMRN